MSYQADSNSDIKQLNVAVACFAVLLMISALLLSYPLHLIFVHTLIETPYADGKLRAQNDYVQIGSKYNSGALANDNAALDGTSVDPELSQSNVHTAMHIMKTRSFFTAWRNLRGHGVYGFFRALPAQLIYFVCYELLFVLSGEMHPVVQLLNRVTSNDLPNEKFSFSPLLIIFMVLLKILLIPVDVVITRQIIGKPDERTCFGHMKSLLSTVGLKTLMPVILPQVLFSGVSILLQNFTTWLQFLYFNETTFHSEYYFLFAVLELFWQFAKFLFIIAPLQAVLYRAQSAVIFHMPPFEAYISYPSSYISPLAELKQIVDEERELTSTWYGRYLRVFKVLAFSSVIIFLVLLACLLSLVVCHLILV